MIRFRAWLLGMWDDPETWLLRNSGAGMMLFFVLSWFAPFRVEQMLIGASLLCAAVFWTLLILGMAGWP